MQGLISSQMASDCKQTPPPHGDRVVVLYLWSGQIGILKKLDFKSSFEKTLHPAIFSVKSLSKGKGKLSWVVFSFSARKSEQGLTPPQGLLARCKLLVQSVLLLADTGEIIPSLIICSHAFFPFSFFVLFAIMGLLFDLQGSWLLVSILCHTPWEGSLVCGSNCPDIRTGNRLRMLRYGSGTVLSFNSFWIFALSCWKQ